jgi:hypothetical protein
MRSIGGASGTKGSSVLARSVSSSMGASIMRDDLRSAADVAPIATETAHQKPDPRKQTDDKPKVEANDNGLQWPLIPFPEDWYGSP